MLRNHVCAGAFVALWLGCLVGPAWANSAELLALGDHDRAVVRDSTVLVAIPQAMINSEVDVGRVLYDGATRGGLIGVLIAERMREERRDTLIEIEQAKADADIAPLRRALEGFDFAGLARQSTSTALARVQWLHPGNPRMIRSTAELGSDADSADGSGGQRVTLTYRYTVSPDFTQLKVSVDIALVRFDAANSARKSASTLLRQRVIAVTELRSRSYDHGENAARWSASNAALARSSISSALQRLERLIPYAISLSPAALDHLEKAKTDKVFAAGFYGPRVADLSATGGEVVLWKQGLVSAVQVP